MKGSLISLSLGSLAASAILSLSTVNALAAPHSPTMLVAPGGFAPPVERMAVQLQLTEAQQTQIRELIEADQTQRDEQRQALRKQIDAVLTPEQRAEHDAMIEKGIDRRLGRIADRVDLSDEQVDAIKTLLDSERKNPSMSRKELNEKVAGLLDDGQRASLRDPRHRPPMRGDCDPR